MITRHFQKGDAASYALYSPCETYRYRLMRLWDRRLQRVAFPSHTSGEQANSHPNQGAAL